MIALVGRSRGIALLAALAMFLGAANAEAPPLSPDKMREWLTYIASDELEGRATFSEGLGLAAAYIAGELKSAGVKPAGDNGSYFQRVTVLGVKTTSRSKVTVEINGQIRTFEDGKGITFPRNMGGNQELEFDGVEFVGYGLDLSDDHDDYKGLNVKGKAVVWLGGNPPEGLEASKVRRQMTGRGAFAIEEMGAAASIGVAVARAPAAGQRAAQTPEPQNAQQSSASPQPSQPAPPQAPRGGQNSASTPDFTTSAKLGAKIAPSVTANDEFLEFLFSAAPTAYAELKAAAEEGKPLAPFTLKGVKVRFDVDADYQVVNTRYTRNVVAMVEGSDPQLKDTYVAFGAHYDHTGYTQTNLRDGQTDRINNGADDDGSGTVALMGLAEAFQQGPHPKRSLLFVWHTGEESGLWGSRYFADNPVVPAEKIVTQLNIDMIGRNDANAVYAVGADRISSELHNLLIDANAGLTNPFQLDFTLNDRRDPERIYFRSDHYSYASKDIPIVFFFSGLHEDYHRPSDTADKIDYEKLSRVTRLIQETGLSVANLDHAPVRDHKGARMGVGSSGKVQ